MIPSWVVRASAAEGTARRSSAMHGTAWLGEVAGVGRWWVGYNRDRVEITAQGYRLEEWKFYDFFEHVKVIDEYYDMAKTIPQRWHYELQPKEGVTAASMRDHLLDTIGTLSDEEALYGGYTWAHGNKDGLGGPHVLGGKQADEFFVPYESIKAKLSYGLAKVMVHACESAAGKDSFLLNNPNGQYVGDDGLLIPRRLRSWGDTFEDHSSSREVE